MAENCCARIFKYLSTTNVIPMVVAIDQILDRLIRNGANSVHHPGSMIRVYGIHHDDTFIGYHKRCKGIPVPEAVYTIGNFNQGKGGWSSVCLIVFCCRVGGICIRRCRLLALSALWPRWPLLALSSLWPRWPLRPRWPWLAGTTSNEN